jgi:hypothetical protein
MRIFYVNVIEQNAGWGAEWFINRSFQSLGHSTYCVDFRAHRFELYPLFVKAPKCDIFFLQRGDYFPKSLIRSVQVPRFFWASELVSRCRDQDRLLSSGLFDHIFFHTNQCLKTGIERHWVKLDTGSVLLNGFDETVFKPIADSKKEIDVLFVGAMTKRRREMLGELRKSFQVHSPESFIATDTMVSLMNRAKVVLNIHADQFLDTETRVFEALGCGAFLLTETLSSESPFTEKELVQFNNLDELHTKLRYYLKHDDERATIAQRGYETALREHTYTKRATLLARTMEPYASKGQAVNGSVKFDSRLRLYGKTEPIRRQLWPFSQRARSVMSGRYNFNKS